MCKIIFTSVSKSLYRSESTIVFKSTTFERPLVNALDNCGRSWRWNKRTFFPHANYFVLKNLKIKFIDFRLPVSQYQKKLMSQFSTAISKTKHTQFLHFQGAIISASLSCCSIQPYEYSSVSLIGNRFRPRYWHPVKRLSRALRLRIITRCCPDSALEPEQRASICFPS